QAALADTAFLQATLTDSIKEKSYFYRELDKLKLKYITSHTNFVLIDTGFDANDIFQRLLSRGVIVRPAKGYNLPTCIRVTLGRHEENIRFFQALAEVLKEVGAKETL
ncbi:MAG: aminotransferase class I/II-fold pyridoxal phosphate-dependent enzyme, partial [Spirochaeta sp.]|nr:aminotransferase class I/II-fold pyridoxal phosphate-dependent enzyme [Spirochaeta sp.]